ncbi:MAG: tetratricopeptide repeat protein [Endomicrobiia bacterium]
MQQKIYFEVFLKPFKEFFQKYKNLIISISATISAVFLVVILLIVRSHKANEYFLQRITVAENSLYSKKFEEGYKVLDEIISTYKKTKYAAIAMYIKATYLYDSKDFETVKNLCLEILKIKKPKSIIVPTMYILGLCHFNLSNFNEAIKIFDEIIKKYPDHFYTPRIYETMALCYEAKGDQQNAKAIYEKMNILYPGSYWSNISQNKINTK